MSMFKNPPPFDWIDITKGTNGSMGTPCSWNYSYAAAALLHTTTQYGGIAVGKIVEFNNEDINNTTQDYLLLVCWRVNGAAALIVIVTYI